jgi:hypothetical protein
MEGEATISQGELRIIPLCQTLYSPCEEWQSSASRHTSFCADDQNPSPVLKNSTAWIPTFFKNRFMYSSSVARRKYLATKTSKGSSFSDVPIRQDVEAGERGHTLDQMRTEEILITDGHYVQK